MHTNVTTSYNVQTLEILYLKQLKFVMEKNDRIPNPQFDFTREYSTIVQVHRIIDSIGRSVQ